MQKCTLVWKRIFERIAMQHEQNVYRVILSMHKQLDDNLSALNDHVT
jgi:hypothetical protein